MTLGTLLVFLGFILALVSLVADRVGRFGGFLLPAAVALVGLGVLLGAAPLIKS